MDIVSRRRSLCYKNIFLLTALIIAAFATLSLFSGTLGRYISEFSGSDTARVAKFGISVNGFSEGAQNINLFDTIYDTLYDDIETHIASVPGEKIIVPGTWGEFEVQIKNNSEVAVNYSSYLHITNTANVPIKFFTVTGGVETPVALTGGDALLTPLGGNFAPGNVGAVSRSIIRWKWDYSSDRNNSGTSEDDDAQDTLLGTGGVASVLSAQISVIAEQSI